MLFDDILFFKDPTHIFQAPSSHASTMERTTQTEPPIISKVRQVWLCFLGDEKFRKQREREATAKGGSNYKYFSNALLCVLLFSYTQTTGTSIAYL